MFSSDNINSPSKLILKKILCEQRRNEWCKHSQTFTWRWTGSSETGNSWKTNPECLEPGISLEFLDYCLFSFVRLLYIYSKEWRSGIFSKERQICWKRAHRSENWHRDDRKHWVLPSNHYTMNGKRAGFEWVTWRLTQLIFSSVSYKLNLLPFSRIVIEIRKLAFLRNAFFMKRFEFAFKVRYTQTTLAS